MGTCKYCNRTDEEHSPQELKEHKEKEECIRKLVEITFKKISEPQYITENRPRGKPYVVDEVIEPIFTDHRSLALFKRLFKEKIREWVKQQLQRLPGNEHIKFTDFIQEYTHLTAGNLYQEVYGRIVE